MMIVNREEIEELIKEFDKQQLEILLNDLQDIDKFTGFKDGAFKYELGKYQASLLVDCIKKQKEVIDKAIELNKQVIKDTKEFYRPTKDIMYSGDTQIDIAEQNLKILKEVE